MRQDCILLERRFSHGVTYHGTNQMTVGTAQGGRNIAADPTFLQSVSSHVSSQTGAFVSQAIRVQPAFFLGGPLLGPLERTSWGPPAVRRRVVPLRPSGTAR